MKWALLLAALAVAANAEVFMKETFDGEGSTHCPAADRLGVERSRRFRVGAAQILGPIVG